MTGYDEWLSSVKKVLEARTGRKDIEVTAGPYRSYNVLVSEAKDGHPIVDFYSVIRIDPGREGPAIAYAVQMLQNWEAETVIHDKAVKDSERFYQMLKSKFPDMELDYSVVDAEYHYVRVHVDEGKFMASFDVWPNMTEADVERIAGYVREYRNQLVESKIKSGMAGVDY